MNKSDILNDLNWLSNNIKAVIRKCEEGCILCENLICAFANLINSKKPSTLLYLKLHYATRLYKGLN